MLLLLKHEYLANHHRLKIELEIYMKLLVYFMVILLVLRLIAEIKNAIECNCNSSSVVPAETVENKQKNSKKKKSKSKDKKEDKKSSSKSKDKSKSKSKEKSKEKSVRPVQTSTRLCGNKTSSFQPKSIFSKNQQFQENPVK